MVKRVLISGGTGFLGRHISRKLNNLDYEVLHLSRKANDVARYVTYTWDLGKQEIDLRALEGVHFIIHLAGDGIADGRWTTERKQQIIDSRVKSAELLLKSVKEVNPPLEAFISASGINYYGMQTHHKIFAESDPPGDDFIGTCCRLWEEAADAFAPLCRAVKIRTGIVLDPKDGALPRMMTPSKWGLGSPLGSGAQWMPWIAVDDLVNMYVFAIENSIEGAFNAVAPQHVTNKEFTHAIAKVLNKPAWVPHVPAWLLKIMFGEMSGLLIEGSRASSKKIKEAGFAFQYPELDSALKHLIDSK